MAGDVEGLLLVANGVGADNALRIAGQLAPGEPVGERGRGGGHGGDDCRHRLALRVSPRPDREMLADYLPGRRAIAGQR